MHISHFSTIVISVCPLQLLSLLLRDSFSRGHSRFCHTHSSANGLQRAPKYWICIYFPLQRGSASQAPSDSPQKSNQIWAGTRRWFPDKCPCHFPLQTWDNSWKVLGWPSGLFIVRKQGCGDSQPASQGAQESTQTHNIVTPHKSSILHSKWLLPVIPTDFKLSQKKMNHLQMSPSLSAVSAESHCVACNSVMPLGLIPSSRLSNPNWKLKLIFYGVPPFKPLLESRTWHNWSPENQPPGKPVCPKWLNVSSHHLHC